MPRSRVGTAASSSYVVFAGGEVDADGSLSAVIDIYTVHAVDTQNPAAGAFVKNLSQARRSPRVIVVSDRYFFFIGGDTTTGPSGKLNNSLVFVNYSDCYINIC